MGIIRPPNYTSPHTHKPTSPVPSYQISLITAHQKYNRCTKTKTNAKRQKIERYMIQIHHLTRAAIATANAARSFQSDNYMYAYHEEKKVYIYKKANDKKKACRYNKMK